MNKLLIELYIPAVNQTYDIYIPTSLKFHEIEAMLISAAVELSNGTFAASSDTVICDRFSGQLLDVNKFALELGLQNGSMLMLI
ncbi:methyltransferase [Paenibacillus alginolyticus]|uniref:Methyltransferase n=1 Tax=Paenibacillus alginolyticus TaxID=59839 RepID=A0ABT4G7A8_9BACL|nr:methyltransferase [Paenibacillus alginolyticus]MCY9692059.1 methyltransferase [Paenibacillus alginolyticus]MEC0144249.1 methyltransferase [Paenibacillus alginolyticus]